MRSYTPCTTSTCTDPASARAWEHVFNGFLHDTKDGVGAEPTSTDPNLMRAFYSFGTVIFAKHVDEIVGIASTAEARDFVINQIKSRFKVSSCGPWQTVLGFEVTRDFDAHTVEVSAERLIADAAAKYLKGDG